MLSTRRLAGGACAAAVFTRATINPGEGEEQWNSARGSTFIRNSSLEHHVESWLTKDYPEVETVEAVVRAISPGWILIFVIPPSD